MPATPTSSSPVPERTVASDHLCLFNADAYHRLHLAPGQQVVRVDHHDGDRLVGSVVGVREGDMWTSGHRAPFGGPDLVRAWEAPPLVHGLVVATVGHLRALGVRTARVRCKPASWSPGQVAVQQALLHHGFAVEQAELSFAVPLEPVRAAGYEALLKKESRKALVRARGLGLSFARLATDEEWAEGHEVLRANRAAKGRPMHLDLDYVLRARTAFPGRIRMFGLRAGSDTGAPLVAAALLYLAAPGHEVVVRWGDHFHELPHSPMYLLAEQVVSVVVGEGASTLDLGIATEDGAVNGGLVQFKRAVGAEPELRLDLVADLG